MRRTSIRQVAVGTTTATLVPPEDTPRRAVVRHVGAAAIGLAHEVPDTDLAGAQGAATAAIFILPNDIDEEFILAPAQGLYAVSLTGAISTASVEVGSWAPGAALVI